MKFALGSYMFRVSALSTTELPTYCTLIPADIARSTNEFLTRSPGLSVIGSWRFVGSFNGFK